MQSWAARVASMLALALSVAGCNTTGQSGLAAGQRTTVAFESIDGPPPAVFDRLVSKLNQEAEARQVPIVTREGFAPYRIRGYMAVGVRRGQTVVSWVWDVYDAQAGRTLRLSGEEKAGRAGRNAWSAVNDETLLRIARSGMEQLSVYFRSPDAGVAVAQDQTSSAPVLARNDDFGPEAYGITRRVAEAPDTGSGPVATSARRSTPRGGAVAQAQ
ncbi:MAG: hypothetical protein ABW198_13680 [Pseudorhodoplanes sp.]